MNCFTHPNKTGVAQCNRCNRAMCKDCSDRCINTDDKFVGLCDECVIAVGKECDYHPSQRAVTRCDKCGGFICGDCFDTAWDGIGGVSSTNGRYCHTCVCDAVGNVGLWSFRDAKNAAKKGIMRVNIFSIIGLFTALAIAALANGSPVFWEDSDTLVIAICVAWVGIGIGCCFFQFPVLWWESIKNKGFIGFMLGLKDGCLGSLTFGIISLFVGAYIGPIILLIYILKRKGHIKKIDTIIERNTKLCAMLHDAHTKSGDPALKAAIHQGAATFAADMQTTNRIMKPILWFFR